MAAEELTLTDECLTRAAEAGFSKKEFGSLKRLLAKKTDEQILLGVAKLAQWNERVDQKMGVTLLYSVTDCQMADLAWVIKSADGWD
jgi:hypothetical protein